MMSRVSIYREVVFEKAHIHLKTQGREPFSQPSPSCDCLHTVGKASERSLYEPFTAAVQTTD